MHMHQRICLVSKKILIFCREYIYIYIYNTKEYIKEYISCGDSFLTDAWGGRAAARTIPGSFGIVDGL